MFEVVDLSDEALVARVAEMERVVATAQARQFAAIAEVHRRAPEWILPPASGKVSPVDAVLVAAAEIGPVLHLAPPTAAARVDLAVAVTSRLPRTFAAFGRGELDLARVRAIAEATGCLSGRQAALVETRIVDRAVTQTAPGVRASARRAAIAVDPNAAQLRQEAAVAQRCVRMQPLEDGVAELWLRGPAQTVRACYQRISQLARNRHPRTGAGASDDRCIDTRRADIMMSLILHGHPYPHPDDTRGSDAGRVDGRAESKSSTRAGDRHEDRHGGCDLSPAATVHVTVGWQVLAGLTADPAWLDGYGPITSETAVQLAFGPHATWRRILTDPATAAIAELGTTAYRPPAALDRFIRARDRTCRFPGCSAPRRTAIWTTPSRTRRALPAPKASPRSVAVTIC